MRRDGVPPNALAAHARISNNPQMGAHSQTAVRFSHAARPVALVPGTTRTENRKDDMPSILWVDVRKGMVVQQDGQLYYVVDRELKTPGNLPSKLTVRLKSLKSGFVNDQRVHPEDKIEL